VVPSRGWENTGKGYVNSRVVGIPRSLPKRDRTPGSPSSPLPKTSVNEGCLPLDVDATFQEVGPGSLIHRILLPKDLLGGKTAGYQKTGGKFRGKTRGKMFQEKRALIRVEPVCLTV